MEQNPYRAPLVERRSRHTLWFLAGFYMLAVVGGIRDAYSSRESLLDILIPVSFALCLGGWAIVDAKQRGILIPITSRWLFFVLASLIVPAYLVWTRGWRGVGWVALHSFGWLLMAVLANVVTVMAIGPGA